MIGIVWVHNKVMNTPSMIVGPSTILLQPHVGRFHASDQEKILIFCANSQDKFGRQVVVYHHAKCYYSSLFGIVWMVNKCDEHSHHDCKTLHHTFTAPCWQASFFRYWAKISKFLPTTSGHVWPLRWWYSHLVVATIVDWLAFFIDT